MGLMRSLLLWSSRSQTLRNTLPRYRFVRRAVRRFMPGENIEDALNAATSLKAEGIASVVTHLGENILREEEAGAVAQHYVDVLDQIHARNLDCHVSVKLTQLGLDLNNELCKANLAMIVERAAAMDNRIWVDMESSPYVERTLEIYRGMQSRYPQVGICLQSYLRRTTDDVESLAPSSPVVRLVKGAYAEPGEIAYSSKRVVDENFFTLATRLLELAGSNAMRIGFGTHDLPLLRRIFDFAARRGFPQDSFEVQMLYGIQREQQGRLAGEGFRVRVLISYGSYWFPWYMRRLAERPANVLFVVKNMFSK